MALMTYLLKDRHGTYYFRRVIPPGLRPFMPPPWQGKANWKRSLKTKLPAEAKRGASKALSACTADFMAAERSQRGEPALLRDAPTFDAGTLRELEADTLRSLLEADATQRSEGDDRRHYQTPEDRAKWAYTPAVAFGRKGMAVEHLLAVGDMLEDDAKLYREALATSDPSRVSGDVRAALSRLGLTGKLTPDEEHEAGLAVLRGLSRGTKLLLERQRGEIVETPKPADDRGPRMSEAFASWKAGGTAKGARKPGDETVSAAEHAVRRFREWHGDIRLGDITREKAREFRDALAQVPTRLKRDLLKLTLRQVIKHPDAVGPPVHAGTINKTLQLLAAIVSHAIREGRMDRVPGFANPFDKGIKLPLDARAAEGRKILEPSDLRAIFSSGIYTEAKRPAGGGGEAAFWMPLLALLTGARQGELAQLRVADLRQDLETGIWFFDIGTEGGRTIKTASSRRKVPVHPVLEEVGLLRYRQYLVDGGAKAEASLWPDMMPDSFGHKAVPWSKWINRWLRDSVGITDPGKVFHSFRHTFKRATRDADLGEEIHDALTGHAGSGGVGRSYGDGFGLPVLSAAIAKVEVLPVVSKLVWAPGAAIKRRQPPVLKVRLTPRIEPLRVSRRPFRLSHAAMAGSSSMA